MPKREETPAKITRPSAAGIFQRERLFGLLDDFREAVTWISAPAGSGKTTLVIDWLNHGGVETLWYRVDPGDADPASFFHYLGLAAKGASSKRRKSLPHLTPEYLPAFSVFSRRFFEAFFARLKPGTVLVMDDFHMAAGNPLFIQATGELMETLPAEMRLVIISRSDPPPEFARLAINNALRSISWDEMRFTLEETEGLLRQRGGDTEAAGRLQEVTGGWAAGLFLAKRIPLKEGKPEWGGGRGDLFDYFMREALSKADEETVDFLLRTAFFPEFTGAMAEGVVKEGKAFPLLQRLVKNNFFIELYPGAPVRYRYHQLFREFLLDRAENRLDPGDLLDARRAAAKLLHEAGFIGDAIGLYCDIREFDAAVSLIQGAAWPLLSQGRNKTILSWIARVPGATLSARPDLLRLAGLCHLPMNPREARGYLESSFRLLREKGEFTAAIPVCGSILEAIIFEGNDFKGIDPYIDWLDGGARRRRASVRDALKKISGIVLFALAYRSPGHRTMPAWLKRAETALISATGAMETLKLSNYLMAYYLFRGEFNRITRVMNTLAPWKKEAEAVPVLKILCVLLEAFHAVFVKGEEEEGVALARKGLAHARETGVGVYDFWLSYLIVATSTVTGDLKTGEECLRGMILGGKNAPLQRAADLQSLSGSIAFGRGEWNEAAEYFRSALDLSLRAGNRFSPVWFRLCLAQTCFASGEPGTARKVLAAAAREKWGHSLMYRYQGLLTSALIDLRGGPGETGLKTLREALSLGRQNGLKLAPFWNRTMTASLLARALEAGIEGEFVKQLVIKHHLNPPMDEAVPLPENWPYPVEIFTLGRFSLIKDGAPVSFSGRVRQKPLQLLKALTAMGGRDVPGVKLSDALWPEADGDRAAQSLKFTLHSLRRLLGGDARILLREGRLTLNPDYCMVDIWRLRRLLGKIDSLPDNDPGLDGFCVRALDQYKGEFLAGDEEDAWAAPLRERLKKEILRAMDRLCDRHEKSGNHDEAVKSCLRALEIDALQEDFYRRLMLGYIKLGRRADALLTYRRCRTVLSAELGVEPSPSVESLYRAISH